MSKKKRQKYGNPANRRMVSGDLKKLTQPNFNDNPTKLNTEIVDNPFSPSAVIFDSENVVLMDGITVFTVDTVRHGLLQEQAIMLTLEGRINKTTQRTQVAFMFGPDGAASIITELLAMSDRFGVELLNDITSRLVTLHKDKNVYLPILKAAVDMALEEVTDKELNL